MPCSLINTPVKVTALVAALQELIEENFLDVTVQGELSNVSRAASGHLYFTLKDRSAQIRCAMFRSQARVLAFSPRDGDEVICRGRISVYPQRGDLQLLVEGMEPEGVGSLQRAFEELRARLETEGLFAAERKQAIPAFPDVIGVVTSAGGAALQDILQILRRRAVGVKVLLSPVRVQGVGAAQEIAEAIKTLDRQADVSVMIVGRGGGSKEDLQAFNEEIVARAIAAATTPIISAVGHEIDVTIADLVADLRAPTPSAAAELVVRNRLDVERHLDHLLLRLSRPLTWQLSLFRERLEGLEKRLKSPLEKLQQQQQQLDRLQQRLLTAIRLYNEKRHFRLQMLLGRLQALSPVAVLARGYAIVHRGPELVVSADQVRDGDALAVTLARGRLKVRVTQVQPGNEDYPVDP